MSRNWRTLSSVVLSGCLLSGVAVAGERTHLGVLVGGIGSLAPQNKVDDDCQDGVEAYANEATAAQLAGYQGPDREGDWVVCGATLALHGDVAFTVRQEVSDRGSLRFLAGVRGGIQPGGVQWTANELLAPDDTDPPGSVVTRGHTSGLVALQVGFDGMIDLADRGTIPYFSGGVRTGLGFRWDSLGQRGRSTQVLGPFWWTQDALNYRGEDVKASGRNIEAALITPHLGVRAAAGVRLPSDRPIVVELSYQVTGHAGGRPGPRGGDDGYPESTPDAVRLLPSITGGIGLAMGMEFN